jgi:hypothetical protein
MTRCKGICARFKVEKSKGRCKSPYLCGNKRCKTCDVYVPKDFDSIHCPCCGMKFALKPIMLKKNRHNYINNNNTTTTTTTPKNKNKNKKKCLPLTQIVTTAQ